jgi:hypothetical protein
VAQRAADGEDDESDAGQQERDSDDDAEECDPPPKYAWLRAVASAVWVTQVLCAGFGTGLPSSSTTAAWGSLVPAGSSGLAASGSSLKAAAGFYRRRSRARGGW